MRLKPNEIAAIKAAAREAFGEDAVVRLFGSRVHDHLKGGDIDLHVEVDTLPGWRARSRFLDLLERPTDGRKIDTVFTRRGEAARGFDNIAYRDGVVL